MDNMTPSTDLISAAEAAQLLGVHTRTVRRWIVRGEFQTVTKFPGLRAPYILNRSEVLTRVEQK
jgi:excisionase family DNA binding protein